MSCSELFTKGIRENCFACSEFANCISEHTKWFNSARDNYAKRIEIVHDIERSAWNVIFDNMAIYTIEETDNPFCYTIGECETMCDVVDLATTIIWGMRINGRYILEDVAVRAIISKLAQKWMDYYEIIESATKEVETNVESNESDL